MSSKTSSLLVIAIIAGVVLGALIGYYLPGFALSIGFIGQLFLNALRVVVVPLILAVIVVGMAAMADQGKIRRSLGKALLYFLGTSAIAVLIGFVLVYVIQPGTYASASGISIPPALSGVTSFSFNELLGSIVPENLFAATAQGQFLGLVIFAVFFGAIVASMGSRGKIIVDFFQSVSEVVLKLTRLLLWAAPIGLLSLVAAIVAANELSVGSIAGSLGMFSLTLAVGFLLHAFVVLPLFLKFLGQRPIWDYFGKMAPALTTALGTSSSAASLPITYECVTERNKVDQRAASFTLPLGAMINMNGTGLYLVVAAMFCAQLFQIDLGVIQILAILGMALVVSLGSSLIPNASLMLLAVVLHYADLPPAVFAGVALVLAIDWFFDRFRTAVNVWGDAVGAAVIGETFDFKTARNVASSGDDHRRTPRTRRQPAQRRRNDSQKQTAGDDRKDRRARPERADARKRDSRRERPQRKRQQDGRETSRSRDDRRRRTTPTEQKKSSGGEKTSGYVLPPVPYHVLEGELRARTKPAREEVKDTKTTVEEKPAKAAPPKEAIDRERARVAAQLEKLDAREAHRDDKPTSEEVDAGAVTAKVNTDPDNAAGEATYPKVDFFSDDDLAVTPNDDQSAAPDSTASDVSDEPVLPETASAEPDDSEDSEALAASPPASYGRGKSRRTPFAKTGNGSESESTPENSEPGKPEFTAENISFGRSKRKK